uniref:hypothetical protein n=2 Tax=Flavobacterium sp. TaxID=239 RepID=UPI00404955F0
MKKVTLLLLSFIVLSCSNDDNSNPPSAEEDVVINGYSHKIFNAATGNLNFVTNYTLENGKLSAFEKLNSSNDVINTGNYSYTNNKISEINRYSLGVLNFKENYNYVNDDLVEILRETYASNGTDYQKISYNHTADTIFVTHTKSLDGINYDTLLMESKIVLDANDNRIYYESLDYFDMGTDINLMSYDANNNPISEVFQTKIGTTIVTNFTNTISYSNDLNSLYQILSDTYSKKTLMMTYQFQSLAINEINPKFLAVNNINTFNSTFSSDVSFQVSTVVNTNNYTQSATFKSFLNTGLFTHFELEYYFE